MLRLTGQLEFQSANFKEAIKKYKKTLEINQNLCSVWNNWGSTLCFIGKILTKTNRKENEIIETYEEAFEKYEKAIQIDNSYHDAWRNFCVALNNYLKIPNLDDNKKKDAETKREECLKKINELKQNLKQ